MATSINKDMTDLALIDAYKAGGKAGGRTEDAEEALVVLSRRYRVRLRNFLYVRMKGQQPWIAQEGDEICDQAWIEIANSLFTFRGESEFFTWACAITLKRLAKHVKKVRGSKFRQAPFDEEGDQPLIDEAPAREAPVQAQLEERELSAGLEAAVLQLEEEERTVFFLREQEGLDWSVIEELMGKPRQTLQYVLFRAVKTLKHHLKAHSPEKKSGASHVSDA